MGRSGQGEQRRGQPGQAGAVLSSADMAILQQRRLDAQLRCQSRRYLAFGDCCTWVRRNYDFASQEEWEEWVSRGEDLSPYIPTRPDEFYSRLGQWRGWSFFLRGVEGADDDPG